METHPIIKHGNELLCKSDYFKRRQDSIVIFDKKKIFKIKFFLKVLYMVIGVFFMLKYA